MFAAAKVMQAIGEYVGAQDVEEWAHLEHFYEPADRPMWLLGAGGRSSSREEGEILKAAAAIGGDVRMSDWKGSRSWSTSVREIAVPIALWPGPVAYVIECADLLGENPFCGFGGGRSKAEWGGPSRIQTSLRPPVSKLI